MIEPFLNCLTGYLYCNPRVEKREISLKQKLSTVQKDKSSIQATLEYLDRKKLDQLRKTWKKVNAYVFADLVILELFLGIYFLEILVNWSPLKVKKL